MAWSHRDALESPFQLRRKTSKSNQDERLTSMMQIEAHQPLLSSLEIQARQNRDSHLKAVLDDPEALKIPGIESLETMRSQIQELQGTYELPKLKTSHRASDPGELEWQLETERKKLSHGEYLFEEARRRSMGWRSRSINVLHPASSRSFKAPDRSRWQCSVR
jgi:hypothetical protein